MQKAPGNKVMLVEDDPGMLAVLRTLLELEGFEVILAPDRLGQEELLDFIRIGQPDMLLLDVHLYGLNGIDLLRHLRAAPELSATRIIMTSGLDVHERCLEAGAHGFLLKPYMPDELIGKLRGVGA